MVPPYVIEVDKFGSVAAIQRADVGRQSRPPRTSFCWQLSRWIENVRSVYQDAGAERVNIEYVSR